MSLGSPNFDPFDPAQQFNADGSRNFLGTSAEIFAGKSEAFFSTIGPDADTTSGFVNAESAVDAVQEQEEERKKDEDSGPDLMDAYVAARQMVESVSVGGMTYSSEEWAAIREGLDDKELQEHISASQKGKFSDKAIADGHIWASTLATIAKYKAEGKELPPELQGKEEEYKHLSPDVRAATEDRLRQTSDFERRHASRPDLAATQAADQTASALNRTTAPARSVADIAATGDVLRDDAVSVRITNTDMWREARQDQGVAGHDLDLASKARASAGDALGFSDTRAGSASVAFNTSASGQVQTAEAAPDKVAPVAATSAFVPA